MNLCELNAKRCRWLKLNFSKFSKFFKDISWIFSWIWADCIEWTGEIAVNPTVGLTYFWPRSQQFCASFPCDASAIDTHKHAWCPVAKNRPPPYSNEPRQLSPAFDRLSKSNQRRRRGSHPWPIAPWAKQNTCTRWPTATVCVVSENIFFTKLLLFLIKF